MHVLQSLGEVLSGFRKESLLSTTEKVCESLRAVLADRCTETGLFPGGPVTSLVLQSLPIEGHSETSHPITGKIGLH